MNSLTEMRMSEALHDLVGSRPFELDLAAIERRGRRTRRLATTARGAFVLGVTAVVVATLMASGTPRPGAANHGRATGGRVEAPTHATSPGHATAPLVLLADRIEAKAPETTGDATLVIRTQTYAAGGSFTSDDLYADNGAYFWAPNESNLSADVAANESETEAAAGIAREAAVAIYAVNGNLATARQKMAYAALDPAAAKAERSRSSALTPAQRARILAEGGTPAPREVPHGDGAFNIDNLVWENSIEVLTADGGNPQVRAGVLRLLSTLSEVAVTVGTTKGQASLTLTATAPATPGNYQEALTIAANTGLPLAFAGGTTGQTPDVSVTYDVSRVTLADIARGKF